MAMVVVAGVLFLAGCVVYCVVHAGTGGGEGKRRCTHERQRKRQGRELHAATVADPSG